MILSLLKESPMWIKTTLTSWLGTATGLTISIGSLKEEIQAWAALIGGIAIPVVALTFHVYITLRKKD
tara:strand:+ start:131 stop:334 length:204 start_codon:yes stop_codon:yes gene_type:complete